jgi:hypothetical protein
MLGIAVNITHTSCYTHTHEVSVPLNLEISNKSDDEWQHTGPDLT